MTSAATVVALVLTYQALKETANQTELTGEQLRLGVTSAQPSFLVDYYDSSGNLCGARCWAAPERIRVSVVGGAENVRYHATEMIREADADSTRITPPVRLWQPDEKGNGSFRWPSTVFHRT
jgi:hypothetical protein